MPASPARASRQSPAPSRLPSGSSRRTPASLTIPEGHATVRSQCEQPDGSMQSATKRPNIAKRRDYVVALARGLEVMRAYSDNKEVMTLSEIARAATLPRATARRSLITLEALGYVSGDGKLFRLAPKVLTLARAYLSSNLLPRAAYPFLESLSAKLGGASCSVSILHEWEVIYVARSSN